MDFSKEEKEEKEDVFVRKWYVFIYLCFVYGFVCICKCLFLLIDFDGMLKFKICSFRYVVDGYVVWDGCDGYVVCDGCIYGFF